MSVSVASPAMELPQSPIDMASQSPKPTRQPQDATDFSAMAQQQAAAAIAFQQQLFHQQQQQYMQAYQAHQAQQQSRQMNTLPPPLDQVQQQLTQHTQHPQQPRQYSAYTHQPLQPSSNSSSPISLHSQRPAPHPYPTPSPDYMVTPRRRAVSGPRSPHEFYMNAPSSPSQSPTAAQVYAHQVGRMQMYRQSPPAPYDPHIDPAYRRARTGSSDGGQPKRDQYPRQVMRPSPLGESSRPQSYHADGIYPNGEAGSSTSVTSLTARERIRLNAGMPSRPSYGSRPSSIISEKSSAPSSPSPGDTTIAETGKFPTPLPSPLSQLSSIDTKDVIHSAKDSIPNAREDTVVQPGKLPPKSGFKGRLRKAFTAEMSPNFRYSQSNTSIDNVSISSTASSASVMIRKLGNVGRLAKRASVIGLTNLFKDGKKGKKADASTGDVSHVTVESEVPISQAGPALSAITATAVSGTISSTPATAVIAAARGQSKTTDDVEVLASDAKKANRKRFSLADFGRSKPKEEESIQKAVMEASVLKDEKPPTDAGKIEHPPFVKSVSATNFREVKSILKKPAVHKVTQDVVLPVRPTTANRAATDPLPSRLIVTNADPKDENGSDVSSSPSDYFSFTEAHLSAPAGTPTEVTPSSVDENDTAVVTPTTPETPHKPTKRSLSFSQSIIIHDTWTASDYDRRGDQATCHRLTPLLAQRIKQELNAFKMEEMEVHLESRALTHFFA